MIVREAGSSKSRSRIRSTVLDLSASRSFRATVRKHPVPGRRNRGAVCAPLSSFLEKGYTTPTTRFVLHMHDIDHFRMSENISHMSQA